MDEQETLKSFAQSGNELRRRLTFLKLKMKEQAMNIEQLKRDLQDQIATMRRMEVDIDIKIRSCKGSCGNVNFYTTDLNKYTAWRKELDTITTSQVTKDKNIRYVNLTVVQQNVTSIVELGPLMKAKQLGLFENIDQYILTLEDDYEEVDNAV